jgi:predicted ester cyclase
MSTLEENKAVVRRAVDEVLNGGDLDAVDRFYAPELADEVKRWIAPFHQAFPDVSMEVVDLVAEGDTVVARFLCSGTHTGVWRGQAPTGRRFDQIDEVYFFDVSDGLIASAWGIEDTLTRMRQLGLGDSPRTS